jgi:hypothetical protein
MKTFSVTPEQGSQIVQQLNDLRLQLWECLDKWPQPDDGHIPPFFARPMKKLPDPQEKERKQVDHLLHIATTHPISEALKKIEFLKDLNQLHKLSDQVEKQVEQGHVEKQLLIELNEKLGKLQDNYGNILVFSATVAAIISGLKDLIDLFLGK